MDRRVGIIGLGRFGRLLHQILSPDFDIVTYDSNQPQQGTLAEVAEQTNLFIATPIHTIADVLKSLAPLIRPDATVLDVCSVKCYPVDMMQTHLPASVDIIATHPLFGPDSYPQHKTIIMHAVRDRYHNYAQWRQYFAKQQFNLVEQTPEAHDQMMAKTQGITHLIGRALEYIDAPKAQQATLGYEALFSIVQQTCNDSWSLFLDLQRYNPYTKAENKKLLAALTQLCHTIETKT